MNLIVAVDHNWGIGSNGSLLVTLKKDLELFRNMTTNMVVIYGKETLKTFPNQKPLKNRTNLILSRDLNYTEENASIFHSIPELLDYVKRFKEEDIFVIGGQSIYEQLLPYTKYAYVTKIDGIYNADRYFPNLDSLQNWELAQKGDVLSENGVTFQFTKYFNHSVNSF